MLTTRVIPCLDIKDGRVVKGVRFSGLRDAGDPVELARAYEQQGADELVILDVSATGEGRRAALDTVSSVRAAISIPLTVGGGVRAMEDAVALLLAGADRVGINTAAVGRPELIRELSDRVGRQCVVVSIDAARAESGWEVVTHAGTRRTGMDAIEWSIRCESLGAGEVLLTSWDRDGSRDGYDTQLIAAMRSGIDLPIIASGGADTPQHMADALAAGADAVLAASIFHDRHTTVQAVKCELAALGVPVRQEEPAA